MRRRSLLCALPWWAAAPCSMAQAWPARPIRLVVPFPAGGATDLLERAIAQGIGNGFGQPIVVDNRPGAGGTLGSSEVTKAAPDGHTLLMATSSAHSTLIRDRKITAE